MTDPILNRKDFLKKSFFNLASQMLGKVEEKMAPLTQRSYMRPPGAQVEALFLALCTRCDACTAACPYEAISVHYGSGSSLDGTPVLVNLREHPCCLCEDTPCITACPTQALVPVEPQQIKIGTAQIDGLDCTAFWGSGCKVCYDICPLKDTAIELREGLPFVIADPCTGCGICEQACPENQAAIRVYPSL